MLFRKIASTFNTPIGGFAGPAYRVISRDLLQKQSDLRVKGYRISAGVIGSWAVDGGFSI